MIFTRNGAGVVKVPGSFLYSLKGRIMFPLSSRRSKSRISRTFPSKGSSFISSNTRRVPSLGNTSKRTVPIQNASRALRRAQYPDAEQGRLPPSPWSRGMHIRCSAATERPPLFPGMPPFHAPGRHLRTVSPCPAPTTGTESGQLRGKFSWFIHYLMITNIGRGF